MIPKNLLRVLRFAIAAILSLPLGHDTRAQIITTYAGRGVDSCNGDGGAATAAAIGHAACVAFDLAGNAYLTDGFNNRVRKVTASGTITTYIGDTIGYAGDGGPATAAKIHTPFGIVNDAAGNIYFGDCYNYCIRKIDATGTISTIAGNGTIGYSGDGGPATAAQIGVYAFLSIDRWGNIYFIDGNHVRKITPAGIINTIAGSSSPGFSGDGGPATNAKLSNPSAAAADSAGNVYIADSYNYRIRKVNTAGIISTIAGLGHSGDDGVGGDAVFARISVPADIKIDRAGNIYFSDYDNGKVKRISSAGIITTIAGIGGMTFSGDGGPATAAAFYGPAGLTFDANENLFVNDEFNYRVRKITRDYTAVADNSLDAANFTIAPNPNKGIFTINLSSAQNEEATITLTNILGQKVKELTIGTNKQLGVQLNVPPGIYFVSAIVAGERLSARLTVE